jgi:hypothetical protein
MYWLLVICSSMEMVSWEDDCFLDRWIWTGNGYTI